MGRSWGLLEHLGSHLEPSWGILSHLGAHLGLSEALLEPSWAILDAPRVVQPHVRDVVEQFQNRIMFSSPHRCQLLTFMVCGAGIIMGTHYPRRNGIQCLKVFGDAHVKYHSCETTSSIPVSTEKNVIQLAPGIANIVWFEHGIVTVSVEVVAESHRTNYQTFADRSRDHIRNVLLSNAFKWRAYTWENKCWACRADGTIVVFRWRASELLHHIRTVEGNNLSDDLMTSCFP